jgi:hypothetical protein
MHDLDVNIANLNDVHGKLKSFGDLIKGTDELKAEKGRALVFNFIISRSSLSWEKLDQN